MFPPIPKNQDELQSPELTAPDSIKWREFKRLLRGGEFDCCRGDHVLRDIEEFVEAIDNTPYPTTALG